MHSDDVPEGFYKEDGKLRKQHDTFGGPHDEDRDTPKLDALVVGEPPFEEAEPDLVMQIMGQMVNNAHDSWSTLNDAKDRDIEKLRFVGFRLDGKTYHSQWVGVDGARYPMFLADMDDLIKNTTLVDGAMIAEDTFETCKKSNAYGIRLI